MSEKKKALFSILLSAFLNGPTGAVTKIGLHQFPPVSFAFLRFLLALLCILLLTKNKIMTRHFFQIAPVSLLAAGNIIFFVLGINVTTATIGILLYAAVPLLTGLILFMFFHETLTNRKIIGIFIGFIGIFFVTFLPLIENKQQFSGNLLGNFFVIIGVCLWSLYMALSKKLHVHFSPLEITSNFIFVTALSLFPFFLFDIGFHQNWWYSVNGNGIFSLVYVSLLATVCGYVVNQYAIKHGGSIYASTTFYLSPIVGFFASVILLGEKLTNGLIIGGILSLLGTYLVIS